jgi:glycosyltransferase involved in cell wall biosynthesis
MRLIQTGVEGRVRRLAKQPPSTEQPSPLTSAKPSAEEGQAIIGPPLLSETGILDPHSSPPAARLRITFLAVIPSPYMVDLFDAMYQDPRFHLRVHYLEKPAAAAPGVYWEEKPLPPYASVLPGASFSFCGARIHVNRGLFQVLVRDQPDLVVVLGYQSITYQLAMYWLSIQRIPWVFWGEIPGFVKRRLFGGMLRWLALRPVARLPDGIAAIGSRAAAVYLKITKRRRPVWNIPYYSRTDALLDIARLTPPTACPSGRAEAHFLFCGQIIGRKGVDLLLRAFCQVAKEHQNIQLTLVGEGPLRASLAASVPEAIRQRVKWAGFKEVDELARYFGSANVFVLPSLHDGWGVVINQAVSAGMAVIASDAVGAGADLVADRVNGIIFPSQDEQALTAALRFFADHPEAIAEFGRVSRERARLLSPNHGAERWYQFSQSLLRRRRGARGEAHHVSGTR